MKDIPIVPGRLLNTISAIKSRLEYLLKKGYSIPAIQKHSLDTDQIQRNIEAFVGSIEIPVGLVGPLLFKPNEEFVYCLAATLEGALVASMNRGAKVVSQSGGFVAEVLHQKMIRTPLFLFNNLQQAVEFKNWAESKYEKLVGITREFSNHVNLEKITGTVIGKSVHLKFIYNTGDASGQNMTTTCTWHAMLWLVEKFKKETNISIQHFLIEGNGASDKKSTQTAVQEGRGVHAVAECFLEEEAIRKTLRTTSDDMIRYYNSSAAMASIDGMRGYNINVANAIATIFAATGQDLASIHESGHGILVLEKTENGLYVSLNLPTLVIGTVGGGTHLTKQKEALELMGCYGEGKIERFAHLITGFALGLEISTYAAIVSGEFAKAHEKLGRNKPVNWLVKSELTSQFLKNCLKPDLKKQKNLQIKLDKKTEFDDGIITSITRQVCNKLIGFIPAKITYTDKPETTNVLIKSKALDTEVIKGLHLLASGIDPKLSDLIFKYRTELEYWNCHEKEINIYEQLNKDGFECTPQFYGKHIDEKREIYLLLSERLDETKLAHINSQKQPELWSSTQIESVIIEMSKIYTKYTEEVYLVSSITEFTPWKATELYKKMFTLMLREISDSDLKQELKEIELWIDKMEEENNKLDIHKTLIHNDFNSRNIAIRNNGKPCIYDWELAVIDYPHRDIVEFLSFVLPSDFSNETLMHFLQLHFEQCKSEFKCQWEQWKQGYIYSVKAYIVTRISFYEVAGIQSRYAFSERILRNSLRMLKFLN